MGAQDNEEVAREKLMAQVVAGGGLGLRSCLEFQVLLGKLIWMYGLIKGVVQSSSSEPCQRKESLGLHIVWSMFTDGREF